MSTKISFFFITLLFCLRNCLKENSPVVETYWESYLSFPYNTSNCGFSNLQENEVDKEAFGYDLRSIPLENINVVNIGFLSDVK